MAVRVRGSKPLKPKGFGFAERYICILWTMEWGMGNHTCCALPRLQKSGKIKIVTSRVSSGGLCPEFTSELCAETWVVKDGSVTALLKGVKLEGQGEVHSAAVAAELETALKLKAQVFCALSVPPDNIVV
jgi:hypothetical protein